VRLDLTKHNRNTRAPTGVWLVGSRSTQHITAEKSQFASYERLAHPERIEGLGGEALAAVGIGRVVLKCETQNGVSTVTLNGVWHVLGARANLFAMRRATDAGARILFEKGKAHFELGGVVSMEAVQRGGLWEIATVKKARAYLAVKGPAEMGRRMGEAARRPQVMVVKKQKEVKPVKYIEVELDSNDERDELQSSDIELETEKHGATEAVGAVAKDVGNAAAEGVGARAKIALVETERVMSSDSGRRYPERARAAPGKLLGNDNRKGVDHAKDQEESG
jgi:hypothetical protein